ncbi:hypothetical protein [Scytonema sp. NUACC26]|uniref:hypothetical protein n=1 Tax=Scytonema sp. NUACC26 TaxID=3140176 RepID=UPI0034DB9054
MQIDFKFLLLTILFLIIFGVIFCCIHRQTSNSSEQTLTKLILKVPPTLSQLIGIFFVGLASFFLVFSWWYTPIVQLNCTRSILNKPFINNNIPHPVCEVVEFNWFGYEKLKKIIADLQGVKLERKTETDKEGKVSYKYQVILINNTDNITFRTVDYSKGESEKYQSVISTIETFLAESLQTSLVFQEDDRDIGYFGVGISLFLGVLSLLIITSSPSIICSFDKEANLMTLIRSRWFGIFGNLVIQYELDEIVDVNVENTDSEESIVYRVVFVLNSVEILPLTYVYSSGSASKYQIAKMIKNFLKTSPESINT